MARRLNIGSVRLPRQSLLQAEIDALTQACSARLKGPYKQRKASDSNLHKACSFLIEGLYQAWCALGHSTVLEVPLTPRAYHSSRLGTINHLRQQSVKAVVTELQRLGWAHVDVGFKRGDGQHVLTQMRPAGALLARFQSLGIQWQELLPHQNVIILRSGDRQTGIVQTIPTPDTRAVRRMRSKLRDINKFLAKQAICLHMSNSRLHALGGATDRVSTPIIFTHTALRRIFSRGSLTKGGRFYGGWWEVIPSEFRPYITINGLATAEVDFREIHPRMLYILNRSAIPAGDLYDDGWRHPAHPNYDPNKEPYRTRRSLFKTVFNAVLNDETGRFRLDQKDQVTAHQFGLSLPVIRQALFRKHPLLKQVARTGIGLDLHFLDSQIAEHTMMVLKEQDIPCLPVHDSFIVPRHQASELIKAMRHAFRALTGHDPALKDVEDYSTDFRIPFNAQGEVDLAALHAEHSSSIHNLFNQSRWQSHTGTPVGKRGPRGATCNVK
jgi:hypothetical protein